MATQKSTAITNRDATPAVLNTGELTGVAGLRQAIGSLTTTTADTSGCKYVLCEVPSNARVADIGFAAAAHTVGKFNVGVYRNTVDGGAVVSTTLFASAIDCANAVAFTSIINQGTGNTIDKQEQPLWQAAGLTVDPRTTFDITAVSTTLLTLGALIGIKATYAV